MQLFCCLTRRRVDCLEAVATAGKGYILIDLMADSAMSGQPGNLVSGRWLSLKIHQALLTNFVFEC